MEHKNLIFLAFVHFMCIVFGEIGVNFEGQVDNTIKKVIKSTFNFLSTYYKI